MFRLISDGNPRPIPDFPDRRNPLHNANRFTTSDPDHVQMPRHRILPVPYLDYPPLYEANRLPRPFYLTQSTAAYRSRINELVHRFCRSERLLT